MRTAAVLCGRTCRTKRIFFPVRGTFFYDRELGPAVNLAMSETRMFPPILRDVRGLELEAFNPYYVERCIDELNREDIGTVMGIRPEGTRDKGPDPCALLPAQLGVGCVALGAHRATVAHVARDACPGGLAGVTP